MDKIEKTDKSLEEAANKYATEWHENPDGSAWKPYFEVSAIKAFIAGAEWQKAKMMEEAVDADVNTYGDLVAGKSWAEFVVEMSTNNLGDKVRIIIVKEEEK